MPIGSSPSATWDAHYATPSGFRHWPSEELVRSMASRPVVDRILEVGCGNGANLKLLSGYARNVVGVDVSPVALDAARRLSIANVELIRLDVSDRTSSFASSVPFDGIVDCMTSQHFPIADHRFVYRRYAKLLNPGGWFFLLHLDRETVSKRYAAVDGSNDPNAVDCRSVELFPDAGFVCLPPASRLVSDVVTAGFNVKTVRGLARENSDGSVAHYTIIDAEVA